MNRRSAVKSFTFSSLAFTMPKTSLFSSSHPSRPLTFQKGTFSMDGNKIRFTHPAIKKSFSMMMLADTHLFRDDARGIPLMSYSKRMAKAYNQTIHFRTGQTINPESSFDETLRIAKEQENALLALIGDIFSFPSEAAIEWALEKLDNIQTPYVYTAGNHDWHYEGMEGTSDNLRDTWIKKRLTPLYQGRDPLMQRIEINGINIIALDNSTYEITSGQLSFLKACLRENKPTVLMLHIPLYAPGRSLGFGCGNPQWSAKNDKNFQLERRLPWKEEGHTEITFEFYRTVFNSTNLLGVLAGHIHDQSIDIINGIPQIVTEANAEGGYLQVYFSPVT